MGVAKIDSPKNQEDTSGTPGYMAPEVITRDQHSFPVDFFALGVIAYECMLGRVLYSLRRGLIEATIDSKFGSKCSYTKPPSSLTNSRLGGIHKQQTSSINSSKESLHQGWDTMELKK